MFLLLIEKNQVLIKAYENNYSGMQNSDFLSSTKKFLKFVFAWIQILWRITAHIAWNQSQYT